MAIFTATISLNARQVADIPNVQLADSTRFVSDPDGYLSASARARADAIALNIRRQTSAEVVVVVVRDMSGVDPLSYAIEIGDKWGVGKSDKDNGMIILVSMEDRQSGIAPGLGMEGIFTDIVCSDLRDKILNARLREGDVDGAVIETLSAIEKIATDPSNIDEIFSNEPNKTTDDGRDGFFSTYLIVACIAFVVMLIYLVWKIQKTRGLERHERFNQINKLSFPFLLLTVAFLGIPILAYLALIWAKKKVRREVPACPNCGEKMRLIDEVHDNDYLTPAQDREERIGSVDYDVWHCDNCGNNEIQPYINHSLPFGICPACGARTEEEVSNGVVRQPTTETEGVGAKEFVCRNCGNRRRQLYKSARVARAVSPVIFLPGMFGGGGGGGNRGGGGGGFGGGSFGGGGNFGGW